MRSKFLLAIVFVFYSHFVFCQQTIVISGIVRDEKKQPLPGATVLVKGTVTGTATDEKGFFGLQIPKEATTLVVSYIGYDNVEVPLVAGQTVYEVNMTPSEKTLEQVVVSVSRQKEKLLDAPASVSVITTDKLDENVVTTPVDELKGVPGVDIIRTGLISSDVVIRGFNNIFSGATLVVVDDRWAAVPSLQVNAAQLIPTSDLDYDKFEVVRGPASALYGPNASNGVISITTKSPLDQEKNFDITVAMTGGFTVLAKSYQQYNNGSPISGNIINPELRLSGKLFDGKVGYKISGTYFQGEDYPNYDPREPYTGDSLVFGTAKNGEVFQPDTLKKYTHVNSAGQTVLDSAQLDIRRFNKDFSIRKWTTDARIDYQPVKDVTITVNGGIANSHNIELTGLGAGEAGGATGGWSYWYIQARVKWKRFFIQYFLNQNNSGNTYLIPQLSPSDRITYNSTSPPTPYPVQLLIDRSRQHVLQAQYSSDFFEKLSLIYGVDVLLTRPNTEGTIDGLFEPIAKLNQVGGYIQANYDPLSWLRIVGAVRVDYNSVINNAAASPRLAAVFKVAENQDIRLTYNRAFDSPNTLNQFLDLSNGLIPNGINVRGIGNPYGWNYNYDSVSHVVQFRTAPYGNTASEQWVTFGNQSYNVQAFNNMLNLVTTGFIYAAYNPATDPTFHSDSSLLSTLFHSLFNGISGANGTVAKALQQSINYANFAETGNYQQSLQNINMFQNLKKINNQYTQTVELGYKGFLFKKLSLDVSAYWSHISNYVSALTSASGAVMLNPSYLGADGPGGALWQNIQNLKKGFPSIYNELAAALASNPAYTNKSIVPVDTSPIWDELVVILSQLPIGTITPNSQKYIGADYILTYENLGSLDVFGADLGVQYIAYEDAFNQFTAGGSFSWVDKDQFTLSSGENVPLNAPKVKASVSFDHMLKKSGFGYGLTFRYQNAYYASSAIYFGEVAPAYILDARIMYRPKSYKKLLLSLNVNDVNNYQWMSFPGTALMGTQVFIKAQWTL